MSAKPGGLVVAFTVGCSDAPSFIGEWLGEYDVPTVMLSKADGGEKAWAKHLTREATPDEALAYWKARALKAEDFGSRALATAETVTQRLIDCADRFGPKA